MNGAKDLDARFESRPDRLHIKKTVFPLSGRRFFYDVSLLEALIVSLFERFDCW